MHVWISDQLLRYETGVLKDDWVENRRHISGSFIPTHVVIKLGWAKCLNVIFNENLTSDMLFIARRSAIRENLEVREKDSTAVKYKM